jgi:hypothetical protein
MKPIGGVLSGLKSNPNVSAFQGGLDAQADAGRGMESAKFDQDMAMRRTQQESQERQKRAQLNTQQGISDAQAKSQEFALNARMGGINTNRAYDYAALQKRNQLKWQQSLLNHLAGDM